MDTNRDFNDLVLRPWLQRGWLIQSPVSAIARIVAIIAVFSSSLSGTESIAPACVNAGDPSFVLRAFAAVGDFDASDRLRWIPVTPPGSARNLSTRFLRRTDDPINIPPGKVALYGNVPASLIRNPGEASIELVCCPEEGGLPLIIQPDSAAPVAGDDTASTFLDTPVRIRVLINDTDPDGAPDPASVAIEQAPANGSVTVQSDGTILYSPKRGFSGDDAFTYTVRDDACAISAEATVTVSVAAEPPASGCTITPRTTFLSIHRPEFYLPSIARHIQAPERKLVLTVTDEGEPAEGLVVSMTASQLAFPGETVLPETASMVATTDQNGVAEFPINPLSNEPFDETTFTGMAQVGGREVLCRASVVAGSGAKLAPYLARLPEAADMLEMTSQLMEAARHQFPEKLANDDAGVLEKELMELIQRRVRTGETSFPRLLAKWREHQPAIRAYLVDGRVAVSPELIRDLRETLRFLLQAGTPALQRLARALAPHLSDLALAARFLETPPYETIPRSESAGQTPWSLIFAKQRLAFEKIPEGVSESDYSRARRRVRGLTAGPGGHDPPHEWTRRTAGSREDEARRRPRRCSFRGNRSVRWKEPLLDWRRSRLLANER